MEKRPSRRAQLKEALEELLAALTGYTRTANPSDRNLEHILELSDRVAKLDFEREDAQRRQAPTTARLQTREDIVLMRKIVQELKRGLNGPDTASAALAVLHMEMDDKTV